MAPGPGRPVAEGLVEPQAGLGGPDTAIFRKADAASRAALESAGPATVALYHRQLAAIAKAAATH
ncbi:hypothetical protein [Cryptosporangium phraense]|uniref:Uncharacterized protein n=1 Tax=Cryptosporangium phraense TaxID=2593070 RepID=A0A545APZ0_9ACTN|nr:hypothetical protein [Cryptosporangium phraense]TQS43376.1 hypothetical protein FL583_19275 [Cryptosporangium phraense]